METAGNSNESASKTSKPWSPSSWRQKTAKQQPIYKDKSKHQKALAKLETLPPLVTSSEVPFLTFN
jgi:3-deoxy-7-phosphoheptulonate synthase